MLKNIVNLIYRSKMLRRGELLVVTNEVYDARNDQEAQKDTTGLECTFYLKGGDCNHKAPAITLRDDGRYACWSETVVTNEGKIMWYKCDCSNEVLHIEQDIDICGERKFVYLNVSIWHRGCDNKPTIRERLRHCWQILKTGKNYADEIILNFDDAKRLHKDLSDIINKMELLDV